MLRSILFTHDDMDGAGCRVVFDLAFSNYQKGVDYDIVNCSNNNIDDMVKDAIKDPEYIGKSTVICFGDICPSIECAKHIIDTTECRYIRIWDHHRTNFPIQQVIPDAQIIPENALGQQESGTSIMYRWFCEKALDDETKISDIFRDNGEAGKLLSLFVDTIRSYDTWEWKDTNNMLAKQLNILFSLLGMDSFCERYVKRFRNVDSTLTEGLIMSNDMPFVNARLESEQKNIDKLTIADIYEIDVRGYKTAFLLSPIGANISDTADQFLRKYPEFDIFAYLSMVKGGKFDFRTRRDNLDIGALIALPIGGGGHPKSSGAPLPDYIKDLLMEAIVCHLNGDIFRCESWWEKGEEHGNNESQNS